MLSFPWPSHTSVHSAWEKPANFRNVLQLIFNAHTLQEAYGADSALPKILKATVSMLGLDHEVHKYTGCLVKADLVTLVVGWQVFDASLERMGGVDGNQYCNNQH
jgi:hypothetical protein